MGFFDKKSVLEGGEAFLTTGMQTMGNKARRVYLR